MVSAQVWKAELSLEVERILEVNRHRLGESGMETERELSELRAAYAVVRSEYVSIEEKLGALRVRTARPEVGSDHDTSDDDDASDVDHAEEEGPSGNPLEPILQSELAAARDEMDEIQRQIGKLVEFQVRQESRMDEALADAKSAVRLVISGHWSTNGNLLQKLPEVVEQESPADTQSSTATQALFKVFDAAVQRVRPRQLVDADAEHHMHTARLRQLVKQTWMAMFGRL